MKTIVADITRAFANTERGLLETLLSTYGADANSAFIVCTDYQKALLVGQVGDRIRVFPANAHFVEIANHIRREFLDSFLAKNGPDDELIVISFHPFVLQLETDVPPATKNRVQFIKWPMLFGASGVKNSRENAAQALRDLMPEADLLTCFRRALVRINAVNAQYGIRMTGVRPLLEHENPCFRKTNPKANVPGLATAVIDLAERNGVIIVDRNFDTSNNPKIWLRDGGSTSQADVAVIAASADRTSVVTSPDAESTEKKSEAAPVSEKAPHRSDQFVDSLRKQDLGPFSRIRSRLYDSLDAVMNETHGTKTAISVIGAAVERTKTSSSNGQNEVPIPWRNVREFLRDRCFSSSVFLDKDGKPVFLDSQGKAVKLSFQSLNAQVEKLASDWRMELDGQLILALIHDKLNLHIGDIDHLAGALYNDRSDDSVQKVVDVILYLLENGRIKETSDHRLIDLEDHDQRTPMTGKEASTFTSSDSSLRPTKPVSPSEERGAAIGGPFP